MGLLLKVFLLTTLLGVIYSAPVDNAESTTVGIRPLPALLSTGKTEDTSRDDSSESVENSNSRKVRDIRHPGPQTRPAPPRPVSEVHRPQQNQNQRQHQPNRRTRDVNVQKPEEGSANPPHSDVQTIPRTRDVPHSTEKRPVREANDSTTQKAVTLPLLLGPNDPTPTYKPLKQ